MSYRRRVHCRYCGDTGHNVNGCAKAKEYIKNNPHSYYAQKAAQRAESAKHRKCSYCSNEGHNRKTCSHIMADMIKVAGLNQDFRRKFIDNIVKKIGLAPGALVQITNTSGYDSQGIYRYDLKDQVGLVTEMLLDNVIYPNKEGDCHPVKVQFMSIYNYNGHGLADTHLRVPNWFILGKEKPVRASYMANNDLEFKVLSPGYYDIDDEESWVKNKEAVENICQSYGNHSDLQYVFDRIDLNK